MTDLEHDLAEEVEELTQCLEIQREELKRLTEKCTVLLQFLSEAVVREGARNAAESREP